MERFWKRSPQWMLIVTDKLLQYRIIEPSDVVAFVFATKESTLPADMRTSQIRDWSSSVWWDLIRITVEKVNGRVNQLQSRLDALEAEEADRHETKDPLAAATQSNEPAEPVLIFPSNVVTPVPNEGKKDSLTERRDALAAIKTEQRKVLSFTLNGFAGLIPSGAAQLAAENVTPDDWRVHWHVCWAREFVRRVSVAASWMKILCTNGEVASQFRKQINENRETLLAVLPADTAADFRELVEQACTIASE